ncbi:group IID secretory phospholipase A2 isoform X2 [Marmota marmota marmota]|uniref:group IID secretory phospholipase A2 isoform X2 n=1 Tax=Marmota marmota marmota TaxID=9994 RepID=UPI0020933319|nr:group IID secretory phospholipase A2 isoform X2 [Marmota marmota marmota]
MRLALLCGLLVAAGLTPAQGGLLNLNKMVRQVTKKIPLFNYWPYGCYCGLGGRGQPKDATDWCCQKHDCCYKHLRTYQCRPKRDHYNYTFSQGDVQCRRGGVQSEVAGRAGRHFRGVKDTEYQVTFISTWLKDLERLGLGTARAPVPASALWLCPGKPRPGRARGQGEGGPPRNIHSALGELRGAPDSGDSSARLLLSLLAPCPPVHNPPPWGRAAEGVTPEHATLTEGLF